MLAIVPEVRLRKWIELKSIDMRPDEKAGGTMDTPELCDFWFEQ